MGVENPQENLSEQQKVVKGLERIDTQLSDLRVWIEQNGDDADKSYVNEAMQSLNTLRHRLEDTSRPRN